VSEDNSEEEEGRGGGGKEGRKENMQKPKSIKQ